MSLTQFVEIVNAYEAAIAAREEEIERLSRGVVLEMDTAKGILDFLEECIPDKDIFSLLLELKEAIAKAKGNQ